MESKAKRQGDVKREKTRSIWGFNTQIIGVQEKDKEIKGEKTLRS